MTNYFEISFSDLSYEKQQDLIETVSQRIKELMKEDGEALFKREWHEPKPKSWQEAFIRDCQDFNEFTEEELAEVNWDYEVDSMAEKQAEDKLWQGFKYLEVEVEI